MPWTPDELALSGVADLSPGDIPRYEERAAFDPATEIELLRSLGMGVGSVVVDLGSGSGSFAMEAGRLGATVIAVDPSPVMCDHLRSRAREHPNVRVVQAGFLSFEHAEASVDFVFTRNALHHLPDFWKSEALLRIESMLITGGVLRLRDLVYGFDPSTAHRALTEWVGRGTDDGWPKTDRASHVRDEYSTYTWILEGMLERAGFTIELREVDDVGIYAKYTCRKGHA